MGIVVKISAKTNPKSAKRAFKKLESAKQQSKKKVLADFYGALPSTYEDGLIYQRKQRNDWE